jgi:hypothetical protein
MTKGTTDHCRFYNVTKGDILRLGGREALQHAKLVNGRRAELDEFMRN